MERVGRFETMSGDCDEGDRSADGQSGKRENGGGESSDCCQTSLQHGIAFLANRASNDEGAFSTQWATLYSERNARLMEFAAIRQLPDRSL